MEVIDDRETGLGHLNKDELLYIHANVLVERALDEHVTTEQHSPFVSWGCVNIESDWFADVEFHGACKACVLAAAALAVNGCARSVVAYVGPPEADWWDFLPIVLEHLTAFYDVMRERHGLPFLLHDEDRVYNWGWS